jgi:hypothetical protein
MTVGRGPNAPAIQNYGTLILRADGTLIDYVRPDYRTPNPVD